MKSLRTLIEKLVGEAFIERGLSSDGRSMERKIKSEGYANLPERDKPGGMIKSLSEEDRETLKSEKPKDFYHRLFGK